MKQRGLISKNLGEIEAQVLEQKGIHQSMWVEAQSAEQVYVSLDSSEYINDINELSALSETHAEYVKEKLMKSELVLEEN